MQEWEYRKVGAGSSKSGHMNTTHVVLSLHLFYVKNNCIYLQHTLIPKDNRRPNISGVGIGIETRGEHMPPNVLQVSTATSQFVGHSPWSTVHEHKSFKGLATLWHQLIGHAGIQKEKCFWACSIVMLSEMYGVYAVSELQICICLFYFIQRYLLRKVTTNHRHISKSVKPSYIQHVCCIFGMYNADEAETEFSSVVTLCSRLI